MTDQIRDRWKPVPISQLKDFQPAEFTWTAPDGREVTLEVYRRGGAKRPSLFLHVEQFYYGPETDVEKVVNVTRVARFASMEAAEEFIDAMSLITEAAE
ncbi:MAG: hypothetical protein BWX84_00044 [Verrucomicrobia bacterium ADurb.Bin118]|nr:MAG: hypothetical protein BWX84_00044 [Verrucomicrobia bacterium ADurb.Bin118]